MSLKVRAGSQRRDSQGSSVGVGGSRGEKAPCLTPAPKAHGRGLISACGLVQPEDKYSETRRWKEDAECSTSTSKSWGILMGVLDGAHHPTPQPDGSSLQTGPASPFPWRFPEGPAVLWLSSRWRRRDGREQGPLPWTSCRSSRAASTCPVGRGVGHAVTAPSQHHSHRAHSPPRTSL